MKRIYEQAEMNIVLFDNTKIIVASGEYSPEVTDPDDLPIMPGKKEN